MSGLLRLQELVRPVRDMTASLAFYTGALGFSAEAVPHFDDALLASAWGERPRGFMRLRLGGQRLLLAACEGSETPADGGATDPRFQHIAIVTRDMAAAWELLSTWRPGAISQGGPQQLPASSGGVKAVKFRDPDGHPVELLEFPPARLPQHWAEAGDGGDGGSCLTLGIDHSAITVTDADRSIAFYHHTLGLRQQARQRNQGPEQARLDGLPAPLVQVVALAPPHPAPHLELLAYQAEHRPTSPTGPKGRPRTITLWAGGGALSHLLTDPDGHTHLVLP